MQYLKKDSKTLLKQTGGRENTFQNKLKTAKKK